MCELWYESFTDRLRAVVEAPPAYTVPSGATHGCNPILEPPIDFASSCLLAPPSDEFLRDAAVYL
ncbi:MAG: hypothetical protein M0038_22235 [Pseudomonadota bacterium]|nr:hypothetical protein [Pseudomonadota bacterium]